MKPPSVTAPVLWLCLVLFSILAIALILPVFPNDYWWYLRVGRDTMIAGAVPQVDTLSYTQAGSPVVYISWGSAVLFWLIYKLGGLTLTVLVRAVLLALAYFLVWLTMQRLGAGRIGSALVLLLAVVTSCNNWGMRPQVFTYPLFALALYLLYRWQNGDKKAAWWLPLISLLWVNLHGSFILLILLSGAALLFGRGDKLLLGIAFTGVLLVTPVNPHGPGAWTFAYNMLTIPAQQFSIEWLPPVNSGWQMNIFFLWLLAFPLLAALSLRKLDRLEWIWFLGFGILALWGFRYVIWFVLLLAVLTSVMLAGWEKKYLRDPKPGSPVVNLALGLTFLLLPLALLPGVRGAWWPDAPSVTDNTPVAAVEWLSARPDLPGPLWSEIGFSSYLEFALPERPTWIDTRFFPFPVEQWQAYQSITYASYDWGNVLDDTGANLLMVSVERQPELMQALIKQSLWCEIYHDDVAAIFQRCPG